MKNNFTIIATNVANIYNHIILNHSALFEDPDELLAITGVIDAWVYLQRGELSISEIIDAVQFSNYNSLAMMPATIDLYDGNERYTTQVDRLLNFVLNLEARLFAVDNPRLSSDTILLSLKKMRNKVKEAIDKVRAAGVLGVPANVGVVVESLIGQVNLVEVRKSLARYKKEA